MNTEMRKETKNAMAVLFAGVVMLGGASLAGCNTLEGAGKDVEKAGEKVQEVNCTEADRAKGACK